jgi:polysaccharide biosynthesis transport protein
MGVDEYLKLIRRYLMLLVIAPITFAVVAYFLASSQAKVFSATAQVLLRPNDPNERSNSVGTGTEILNADRIVQAQADIARGPSVRQQAAARLGTITELELKRVVTVTPAVNSNILNISAADVTPSRAAEVANGVASAFIENRRLSDIAGLDAVIADLDSKISELRAEIGRNSLASDPATIAGLSTSKAQYQSLSDRRLQISIDRNLKRGQAELIASASAPTTPVSPKPERSAVLAGVAGLLAAIGLVLLRDRLDTRLRTREEAEAISGMSTLTEIPFDRSADKGDMRVAAEEDPDGVVAESIRSLRVSLRFLGLEQPLKLLLVTSALPGDGKSTVSINLAHSYAEAGSRTLLVSADLRRPQVERLAAVDSERGLVELLDELAEDATRKRQEVSRGGSYGRTDRRVIGSNYIKSWCHQENENLWLLPAGSRVANPVEILGSAVSKDFFARTAEDFDVVIVDSPPVLAVADAVVLSQFVDGVIVVTSVQKTQRKALERAVEVLRNGNTNLLGLAVNRVRNEGGYGYGSGYGYGAYGENTRTKSLGVLGRNPWKRRSRAIENRSRRVA